VSRPPAVSFVVPAYNFARYLGECVRSLLVQDYRDFEVLVMDDASTDATPEVARSFGDPRVRHVRNPTNQGHLRNFNRGVELARGRYVWLISADDRLRHPGALGRYVRLLEAQSRVGYVFCPAIALVDGRETTLVDYSHHGARDAIFPGAAFARHLLAGNTVVAASAMARRECYARCGPFPLDLSHSSDWYMWCMVALHWDVAYVAEPMVNYRWHAASLGSRLRAHDLRRCVLDDLAVLYRVRAAAAAVGHPEIVAASRRPLALVYARGLARMTEQGRGTPALTVEEFEASLARHLPDPAEARYVRARALAEVADWCYRWGDLAGARRHAWAALRQDVWMPKVLASALLLLGGRAGVRVRRAAAAFRRGWARPPAPG
jgi:glycosyltransferase involved in cell wall biosynthesis